MHLNKGIIIFKFVHPHELLYCKEFKYLETFDNRNSILITSY